MSGVSQIEESIQALPPQDFFNLLGWMAERHLEVLSAGEYEAQELETALLKALDGPRHLVDDALFAEIRHQADEAKR